MKTFLKHTRMEENKGEGGEGSGGSEESQSNWRDTLPDDIKGNAALADYKDVAAMAKSHIEAQKMVGSSIRVPSAEAGEEDLNKFYDSLMVKAPNLMMKPNTEKPEEFDRILKILGKPEEASSYEVTKDLGEYKVSDERMAALRVAALDSGLTKNQFDSFVGNMLQGQREAAASNANELNESRTALMAEWGLAFDGREKEAIAALKKTGAPSSLIQQAETSQLGADTLKWAYGLVTTIGREGLEIGIQDGGTHKMTPDEAQSQITEVLNNREHAYWNPRDPSHKTAKDKMVELHRMKHG